MGKTSLVNNMKAFFDNPSEAIKPFLTGMEEHQGFHETEVLEMYNSEIQLDLLVNQSVRLEQADGQLSLINFKAEFQGPGVVKSSTPQSSWLPHSLTESQILWNHQILF